MPIVILLIEGVLTLENDWIASSLNRRPIKASVRPNQKSKLQSLLRRGQRLKNLICRITASSNSSKAFSLCKFKESNTYL